MKATHTPGQLHPSVARMLEPSWQFNNDEIKFARFCLNHHAPTSPFWDSEDAQWILHLNSLGWFARATGGAA